MNDSDPRLPDAAAPESADVDADFDDVEGHRMLSPEQAQQRSDAARIERERRFSSQRADDVDDVGI